MTGAYLIKGTGLAHCRICKKLIKKGQISIKFWAFRTECQVHRNPDDCVKMEMERIKSIELLVSKNIMSGERDKDIREFLKENYPNKVFVKVLKQKVIRKIKNKNLTKFDIVVKDRQKFDRSEEK